MYGEYEQATKLFLPEKDGFRLRNQGERTVWMMVEDFRVEIL